MISLFSVRPVAAHLAASLHENAHLYSFLNNSLQTLQSCFFWRGSLWQHFRLPVKFHPEYRGLEFFFYLMTRAWRNRGALGAINRTDWVGAITLGIDFCCSVTEVGEICEWNPFCLCSSGEREELQASGRLQPMHVFPFKIHSREMNLRRLASDIYIVENSQKRIYRSKLKGGSRKPLGGLRGGGRVFEGEGKIH